MTAYSDLPTSLQPGHPLLRDGYNEGFRAPDLGWVGAQDHEAEMDPLDFNNGSALYSNFWAGPLDHIKSFAQALVSDFQGWLVSVDPEDPDEAPVVSVAYWEDAASGAAMVATQSITPDFMLPADPDSFGSFGRFADGMLQVAFDGNDNGPHLVLETITKLRGTDVATYSNFIVSCVVAGKQDELQELSVMGRADVSESPKVVVFSVEGPPTMMLSQGRAGATQDNDTGPSSPVDTHWTPESLAEIEGLARKHEAARQSKDLDGSVDPAADAPTASPRM